MNKPTYKPNGQHTYHRDLTVSFFSIINSQWRRLRADLISDAHLSTMNDRERARIARMATAARAIHAPTLTERLSYNQKTGEPLKAPADPHCESDAHEHQSSVPSARRAPLDFTAPGSGVNAYTYLADKDWL